MRPSRCWSFLGSTNFTSKPHTLKTMTANDEVVSVVVTERRARVTEIVDKYNLMALPVVDETGRLVGTITADDIISVLRQD